MHVYKPPHDRARGAAASGRESTASAARGLLSQTHYRTSSSRSLRGSDAVSGFTTKPTRALRSLT
jgi:hypothetical protein